MTGIRLGHPDGQRIAFTGLGHLDKDWDSEIYVMDADGKNRTRLTDHLTGDRHPVWSPDGQRIAVDSFRDGAIYVIDADGKNRTRLTEGWYPSWSPDGQRIAFASDRDGYYDIYVMDADGKNQTQLTDHPVDDEAPAWSPDGQRHRIRPPSQNRRNPRRMACDFGYLCDGCRRKKSDPTHQTTLSLPGIRLGHPTDNASHSTPPPSRDGYWQIYVMDADGKNQTRLTDHPATDWNPSWSPDGQRIAFSSNRIVFDSNRRRKPRRKLR